MYVHIVVKKENKEKLMNECVKLFLEYHPEMLGMKLSQDFMLSKLIEYYLK